MTVARWLPALLLGIVAFALVLDITDPVGPGLDPDAQAYLGSAESLALRGEFHTPTARWWSADSTSSLAHFPPGYVTAIAIPVRLGMSPIQSARLVEAVAAFVTVVTLVLLVSDVASVLAGVLLATSLFAMSSMHEVHVSVLSEPLFLAFTALTLAAMVRRPDRPVLAGLAATLGSLTRYAGISLVGAAALWSFSQGGSLAIRIRRTMTAVIPAIALQGLWLLRTRHAAGSESIRKVAWYGNLEPTVKQGARTMQDWLIPDPDAWQGALPYRGILTAAAGIVLALLTLAGVQALRRQHGVATSAAAARDAGESPRTQRDAARLLDASALIICCYFALLVVSRLIADPGIPFDERIMSPVILLVATMVATGTAIWWSSTTTTLPKIAVLGALMGWWAAAASVTRNEARYALETGSDFAGEPWRKSELLEWARTDGARYPLYTNWTAVVYFYLHRPARDVPMLIESRRLGEFVDTLRVRNGRVLAFTVPGIEYVPMDTLLHTHGLRVVAQRKDGVVLAATSDEPRLARPRPVAP